jgi:uncharacterized caspase-like protein
VAEDVLVDWIKGAAALKRILVLDTCHSGAAITLVGKRNPFAFRGSIERLNRASGLNTIGAAVAGEEAQEVSELGHGVLTYALLAGLRAVDRGPLQDDSIRPANPDQVTDVLEWFAFAAKYVPILTKKYLGREQDIYSKTQGVSFPVLPVRE